MSPIVIIASMLETGCHGNCDDIYICGQQLDVLLAQLL